MTHEALPWLGLPPAVDLANTVMITPAGELDLLEDEGQLGAWIAAERGRIVGVEAASGRLDGVVPVGRTSAGPPDDEGVPRGQRGVTPPGGCDACW